MDNEYDNIFNDIEEFWILIETQLAKDTLDVKFEGISDITSQEEISNFLKHYSKQQKFDISFTQIFRKSMLISAFSMYEVALKKMCYQHFNRTNSVFAVKDLNGSSDLQKIKLYLKKQCNVDFGDSKYNWSFIDKIRKIRNCIVHENSACSRASQTFSAIQELDNLNKEYFEPCYMKIDESIIQAEDKYEIEIGLTFIMDSIKAIRTSLYEFHKSISI